jgi:hypothetical protein
MGIMELDIKSKLLAAKKRLIDIRKVKKSGVFKNSDKEILAIENQIIGEVQILNHLNSLI